MIVGIWIETRFSPDRVQRAEPTGPDACDHADRATIFEPRSEGSCEECRKNNYKWVHLRLCLSCGHTGCCDTSVNRHATKHFLKSGHPIMASLESGEFWAWCYEDERFVPDPRPRHPGRVE